MHQRIIELFLFYPLFLFSLSFHEAAHALIASKLGDQTAKYLGRITLNPFPHMDMIGTFFLPVFGILTGVPVIGWGKPVPVNTYNFRHPRQGHLWVALAGPVSNMTLAIAFALLAHIFAQFELSPNLSSIFAVITHTAVILNLMLAFFNLLPLPPLDGGAIFRGILPERLVEPFDRFAQVGIWIVLILFISGALRYLLIPVLSISGWLLP